MVDYIGPDGHAAHKSAREVYEQKKILEAMIKMKTLPDLPKRPPKAEMRVRALSLEEFESAIKQYATALKQNQTHWQKESKDIINEICKLADNAADLYEAYVEYPFADNFKDHKPDDDSAAIKRDFRMSLINQAISLYFCKTLENLDKLKITTTPEFKQVEHSLNTLKAEMRERAVLDRTAQECNRLFGLASSQFALSEKYRDETTAHNNFIQALNNRIGYDTLMWRVWKAGHVNKYSKQIEERVTELESVYAQIERHRQETEAKIGTYRNQAQKRANALINSQARQAALDAQIGGPGVAGLVVRRALGAGVRLGVANARATATPIGNTRYKNLVDTIIARVPAAAPVVPGAITGAALTAGVPIGAINPIAAAAAGVLVAPVAAAAATGLNPNIVAASLAAITAINPGLQTSSGNAETRAGNALVRAREAEARAREAKARAREAEARARIAKAYNRNDIQDGSSKSVAKYAKNVEKLEKQVAGNNRLIESNEKILQSALAAINHNLGEMQNILQAPAGAITPDDSVNLEKCVNSIEKAEIAKNSALAALVQATREEQIIINNIRNELRKERNSVIREHVIAARISAQGNRDLTRLQDNYFLNIQTDLEDILLGGTPAKAARVAILGIPGVAPAVPARQAIPILPGLINLEKEEHKLAVKTEKTILNPDRLRPVAMAPLIAAYRGQEAISSRCIDLQRAELEEALETFRARQMVVADVLKRNAIHMEQDIVVNADEAVESLQEIKNKLANKDEQGLKNCSLGHLFIDPEKNPNKKIGIGKTMINGVWFPIRNIQKWTTRQNPGNGQWETAVDFRADLTEIKVSRETRDAGKVDFDPIETKRLLNGGIHNSKYSLTLKIEGDTHADARRQWGILTFIDYEAKSKYERGNQISQRALRTPGTTLAQARAIAEAAVPGWQNCAGYKKDKRFDMRKTESIHVMVDLVNEKVPAPCLSFKTVELMLPDPVINHAAALALRQGEGWSDEEKRRMWKFDLGTLDEQGNPMPTVRLPSGDWYPMTKFDWTETKCDEVNGLTLQFKGPTSGACQLNLLAAGSSDIFNETLSNGRKALEEKGRNHAEKGIEWLKQSIKSYDTNTIDEAIGAMQIDEGTAAKQSNMTKKELEEPPKNRVDLKKLRKKINERKDAPTPQWVTDSMKSTAKMLGAGQSYMHEVKERIQAIHKNDPLSADDVWQSRGDIHMSLKKHDVSKHRSSKKKQELLYEIHAAEHLDKTVPFQLLVDPKRGPAGVNSPVKNVNPNGLELLQEYNLYKNKQDFANDAAGMRERQNVVQYIANIETELRTNPNIDPYHANQYYLEKAMEAARDGHFLSKNGTIGASEYIRNLKQVDLPASLDSLANKRQADEYHWVTYLKVKALGEANREGRAELLEGALPVAKQMQVSRSNNLELAQRALDLETPSKEAEKILKKMQEVEFSLPWSESESEKAEKAKVDLKDKTLFDPKAIAKKSPEDLAKDASKVAEKIYADAIAAIERRVDSIADPGLQQKFREKAVELVMDQAKQAFEINKQDKAIQNQWQKYEELIKEMNRQRWKDLWKDLALLWLKNSVESGSKIANNLLSELEKIAMAFAKA